MSKRNCRLIKGVFFFAICFGPYSCCCPGQTDSLNVTMDRQQADEEFQKTLQSLVAWCREQGLEKESELSVQTLFIRDSQRQYIFLPDRTNLVSGEGLNQTWLKQWLAARQTYAAFVYQQANAAAALDQGARAFQLLHEVLHWDPENSAAREALGHRKIDGVWAANSERFTIRTAAKAHPEMGWPSRSYLLATTENFEIASQADEATTRFLAEQLQRWHWVWRQVFFDFWSNSSAVKSWIEGKGQARPASRKYRIVFFRDREQYVRELERFVRGVGASTGYYNDEMKLTFFFASNSGEIIDTWKHELAHQLFQESIRTRKQPFADGDLWLGEGIAMYMESLRDFGQFVTLGGFDARRLQYARVRKIRDGFYLPFAQLNRLTLNEFQAHEDVRHLYSQSAGITQFLMVGCDGTYRDRLIEYLQLLYEGKPKKDSWSRVMNLTDQELDLAYSSFLQPESGALANRLIAPAAVSELALPGMDLSLADFQLLGTCANLLWLDVSGSELSAERVEALKNCSSLTQLFASGSPLQAGAVQAIVQLPVLTELDLSNCNLSKVDLREFEANSRLKILNLSRSQLPADFDTAIIRWIDLQTLDLTGASISENELQKIRDGLPKLEIRR